MNLWILLPVTVLPFGFAALMTVISTMGESNLRLSNFLVRITSARKETRLRIQVRTVVNAVNAGSVNVADITYSSLYQVNKAVLNAYPYLDRAANDFHTILELEEQFSKSPRVSVVKELFTLYADVIVLGDMAPKILNTYSYMRSFSEDQWWKEVDGLKDDIKTCLRETKNLATASYKTVRNSGTTDLKAIKAGKSKGAANRARPSERLVKRSLG